MPAGVDNDIQPEFPEQRARPFKSVATGIPYKGASNELSKEHPARPARALRKVITVMYDFSRQMRGALTAGLLLMAQPLLVTTALAQQQKPNILFILADNIGYGDIGVYGGGELRGAPTPRIDQLAAEGLRLTQYLIEPACTPSRVMTLSRRSKADGSVHPR